MRLPSALIPLCKRISQAGGRAYVVGGWVRDLHLGLPSNDIDVEVFGLSQRALLPLLALHGKPQSVGKSFGVIKLRVQGEELDVALPLDAQGCPDPTLSLRQASERRDLRCNALYYDPLTQETNDPTGGLLDLQRRVLRCVAPQSFVQDRLRTLRAVRLACTKDMELAPELLKLLSVTSLAGLAAERVAGELFKTLESQAPAKGLRLLHQSGLGTQLLPALDWEAAATRVESVAPLRPQLAQGGAGLALVVTAWLLPLPHLAQHMTALKLHTWRGHPVQTTAVKLQRIHGRSEHPMSDYDLRRAADELMLSLPVLLSHGLMGSDPAPTLLRAQTLGVSADPLPVLMDGKTLRGLMRPGPEMGRLLKDLRESQFTAQVSTSAQAHAFVQAWLAARSKRTSTPQAMLASPPEVDD